MEFKFKEAFDLYKNGQLNKSKEICLEILKNYPKHFDSFRLLSIISYLNKNYEEASKLINKAIKINPNQALAYYDQGTIFHQLEKFKFALKSFNKSIQINPNYSRAFYNRGNTLKELNKYNEAIESFKKSIEINPNDFESYNNCGNLFFELGKYDLAFQNFDKAIKINPNYADGYYNLANTLYQLGQLENSIDNYKKAIKLNPNLDFLLGKLIHVKSRICDWSSINDDKNLLKKKILEKRIGVQPMSILSLYDSPSLHKITAKNFVHENFTLLSSLDPIKKRKPRKKIRIGYYSGDFHNHAISYLLAYLFELHDKSKFELFAFSFGPKKNDEMRKRISSAFKNFYDLRFNTDKEIVKLSRKLHIDIAIDLSCFTLNNKFGVFIERCAPIQINYLGYPGTSGVNCMDYIIADKNIIPKKFQKYYSEKIIFLPNTYQCNDSTKKISDKVFKKEEFGLPKQGFIFCCFNQSYKITPNVFNIWIRILNQVPGSVIWLFSNNLSAIKNLQEEAKKRGVNPNRIIFAKKMPLGEHLARHQLADLFLDTFPYTAHTTCSDALWSGLPVLTFIGESFASRVSASLLNSIDLSELITKTEKAYENLAIKLAKNPVFLNKIKKKLEKNRLSKPLFNTKLFTKHIEIAYTKVYSNYIKNKKPENIEII